MHGVTWTPGGSVQPPTSNGTIALRPTIDSTGRTRSTSLTTASRYSSSPVRRRASTPGCRASRSSAQPSAPAVVARLRDGDPAYLDATVRELLRVRPVLSITPRKGVEPCATGGWTLPPGVHVTPCIYLTHRRPDLWDDPTAFRPERFLDGAPEPYTFIPFGGGVRRCVGAAFASLEMKEVLRAVARRFELRPAGGRSERMRRRSITMTPSRGGYVVPHSSRHADVLPSQPADRQLPDLQPGPAG